MSTRYGLVLVVDKSTRNKITTSNYFFLRTLYCFKRPVENTLIHINLHVIGDDIKIEIEILSVPQQFL